MTSFAIESVALHFSSLVLLSFTQNVFKTFPTIHLVKIYFARQNIGT